MKLTNAQEKQLKELPEETQKAILSDTLKLSNRYNHIVDLGPLKPFLKYFAEKNIPRKSKSAPGEAIFEVDLSKVEFDERVFIHTLLKDVKDDESTGEEVGDNYAIDRELYAENTDVNDNSDLLENIDEARKVENTKVSITEEDSKPDESKPDEPAEESEEKHTDIDGKPSADDNADNGKDGNAATGSIEDNNTGVKKGKNVPAKKEGAKKNDSKNKTSKRNVSENQDE